MGRQTVARRRRQSGLRHGHRRAEDALPDRRRNATGVYAVPIAATSTTAPEDHEFRLIVAKSTCPFPGSLNLLDTVTSGPHGEIAILAQDRPLAGFPMVIEVGTIRRRVDRVPALGLAYSWPGGL